MKKRDWKKFDYDTKLNLLSWEIRALAFLLKHTNFTGDLALDRSCQAVGRMLEKLGNRVKTVSIDLQKFKENISE